MLNEFICIGLICIAAKSFYDVYADPNKHIDLDHYPLFECDVPLNKTVAIKPTPKTCNTPHTVTKSPVVEKTTTTTPPPKKKDDGYTDLQKDCFEALKSLGVKTNKERTFLIHNTFNNHNPKTVQEFLQLALVRNNEYN
jgi:hypothetical protein